MARVVGVTTYSEVVKAGWKRGGEMCLSGPGILGTTIWIVSNAVSRRKWAYEL